MIRSLNEHGPTYRGSDVTEVEETLRILQY
jgi:hypothetical protein